MGDRPPAAGEAFDSFDEIVARYEKPIFNVVYRILGDYDEAADVTQETFISAYKSFHRFRRESSVYTWLYQIALNHSRNRLRRRRRHDVSRTVSLDAPVEEAGEAAGPREIPDERTSPEKVAEKKELRAKILAAIESLPPDYREVVVLRELQGLSYNQIADATGISLDNVKTRLSRARAMLRRRLGPYYLDGGTGPESEGNT